MPGPYRLDQGVYLRWSRSTSEASHLPQEPEHAQEARRTARTMRAPIPRSVTRRRKEITTANRKTKRYAHLTTIQPSAEVPEDRLHIARVNALLWAISHLERALWLETGGQLGDEIASPRRIAGRIVVRHEDVSAPAVNHIDSHDNGE
jgi:hypothetical protein